MSLRNILTEVTKKEDEVNHIEENVAKKGKIFENKAYKLKEEKKDHEINFVAEKMFGNAKNVGSSGVRILTADDLIDNGCQSNSELDHHITVN
ncbi:hypothetical protein MTR_1g036350 [Medicago truncatula]|uniref:Uncharacterized protein n=1 Tax=Medicago truncatula TaxID=3880 RepID=A0A072VGG9_MEDTR|nr:hypothetical protein MTR_1g036350 [Medicago truncatula]